jgi:hypothetical protein
MSDKRSLALVGKMIEISDSRQDKRDQISPMNSQEFDGHPRKASTVHTPHATVTSEDVVVTLQEIPQLQTDIEKRYRPDIASKKSSSSFVRAFLSFGILLTYF